MDWSLLYLHTGALVISSNKAKVFPVYVISHKLAILSNIYSFSPPFFSSPSLRSKGHVHWTSAELPTYVCAFWRSPNTVPSNYNFMSFLYSLSLTNWFWKQIFTSSICFSYACLGSRAAGSSLLPGPLVLSKKGSLLLSTAALTGHNWNFLLPNITYPCIPLPKASNILLFTEEKPS